MVDNKLLLPRDRDTGAGMVARPAERAALAQAWVNRIVVAIAAFESLWFLPTE